MKLVDIKEVDGHTEIKVSFGKWIFKKVVTFRTNGKIGGDFYNWLQMPGLTLVSDNLSFQLDAWKKVGVSQKTVNLLTDGEEWKAIVGFTLAHRNDIENDINDYGDLLPVLKYINRNAS